VAALVPSRICVMPCCATRYTILADAVSASAERRNSAPHGVVSPEVFRSRIDLELGERDDDQAAGRFVAKVLADLGLA
jgi:hypothetical protein